MAKQKFESRLQVWVPSAVAEAFEALAADGMLAVSDHLRAALCAYLRALGITTTAAATRPIPNGHHQEEQADGLRT
jgi:hypothetical protein